MRKALVEYCNYLDCVKQGRENCILDINFNTFDTWRRYKERVGWMYCGRKDYSQQSFHSLASSSNLVSAKSKQGLTSKPVANTTSSSQSTSAIFSSQSKKNFLSMSKSNLLKSSNAISIPAAQPNRPSSARSEVNLINNNTTTKSINNTGPNNAAFSSVPLSESLQRLADLARFSSLVSDSFRDSREKAMTIAEVRYVRERKRDRVCEKEEECFVWMLSFFNLYCPHCFLGLLQRQGSDLY